MAGRQGLDASSSSISKELTKGARGPSSPSRQYEALNAIAADFSAFARGLCEGVKKEGNIRACAKAQTLFHKEIQLCGWRSSPTHFKACCAIIAALNRLRSSYWQERDKVLSSKCHKWTCLRKHLRFMRLFLHTFAYNSKQPLDRLSRRG